MNWLTIIMITVLVFCIINGLSRGFIRTAAAMTSILLSLVLVYFLNPYMTEFIKEKTPIYEKVKEKCSSSIDETIKNHVGELAQDEIVNQLPMPDNMKQMVLQNLQLEQAEDKIAENVSAKVSGFVADYIVGGISFLLTFLLASILVKILFSVLDGIFHLPVLSFVNRLGGAAAGCVQGLLLLWIFCLIVALLFDTEWGGQMASLLNENQLTKALYNTNPFIKLITFWK